MTPLIYNNQFAVDFKEKSYLFNTFFAKQCTPFRTGSNLPIQILRGTNGSFNTITFTKYYVLKVTKKLNSNKVRRHDQISICMLHICEKTI